MVDCIAFASTPRETLGKFKKFYFSKFPELFTWYYPSRCDNMILSATRDSNDNRSLLGKTDSIGYYFFSVAVFFHVLIPQVIIRVAGRNAFDLFIKSSAWPRFSAGMGGPISAEQWLYESDKGGGNNIYPSLVKARYYNDLLDITLPFFQSEISAFLKGDQPSADRASYKSLCEIIKGREGVILNEVASATKAAEKYFENGKHPVYYLTDEEMY